MDFDAQSRPARSAGSRLVFTDEGSHIEDAAGGRNLPVSELGAIIWRSLDGSTTIDEIASDIAEARTSTVAEEAARIVEFVQVLGDQGLLGERQTSDANDDAPAAEPDPVDVADETEGSAGSHPLAFDFIMDPYPMASDPAGRPTSLDLFLATLPADAVQRPIFEALAERIIDAIGPDRTVWGMKLTGDEVAWELYFYPHRRDPDTTPATFFERARNAFEGVVGWAAPRDIPTNASLVSFEFTLEHDAVTEPREIDVYHPVEGGADMIVAYRHSDGHHRLKNTYELFRFPDRLDALKARLESSRFASPVNEGVAADHWLGEIEASKRCSLAWCSYKPEGDGIYLGLVDASDLARFLDRYSYPAHLRGWVLKHLDRLDHLRYDLGFDYTVTDGTVDVAKSGFYGYF